MHWSICEIVLVVAVRILAYSDPNVDTSGIYGRKSDTTMRNKRGILKGIGKIPYLYRSFRAKQILTSGAEKKNWIRLRKTRRFKAGCQRH